MCTPAHSISQPSGSHILPAARARSSLPACINDSQINCHMSTSTHAGFLAVSFSIFQRRDMQASCLGSPDEITGSAPSEEGLAASFGVLDSSLPDPFAFAAAESTALFASPPAAASCTPRSALATFWQTRCSSRLACLRTLPLAFCSRQNQNPGPCLPLCRSCWLRLPLHS